MIFWKWILRKNLEAIMNKGLSEEQKAKQRQFLAEQLWKDYLLGAEYTVETLWTMKKWDCSELYQGSYKAIGIDIVDGAANQYANSYPINLEDIDTGDGAYMGENGVVTHIAEVYDNNIVIEAAFSKNQKVVATSIKEYVQGRGKYKFMGFRRLNKFPAAEVKPTGGSNGQS
jgi:cell wall-associated NlpC family hydrolase